MNEVLRALTIAGSDSGGGAGIQADLKTFAALGVHGMAAVTSITAQNTVAVEDVQDVDPRVIRAQIDAVVEDIGVDVVKTGMLHTRDIIRVVCQEVDEHEFQTVVDPVMIAKSGARLLKEVAAGDLVKNLIPLARVVTPNATEAEVISGIPVKSIKDAEAAAEAISNLGAEAVVVKGGHISGSKAIDVLFHRGEYKTYEAERLETSTTHGTGCSFSSAIASELAKGRGVAEAVGAAKEFINAAIRFGLNIGRGHGPVNPMAQLYNRAEEYYTVRQVREAVKLLEANREVSELIPESQSNMVAALPHASDTSGVVGIPGRIVKVSGRVKASSCPEFGASSHVANTVLTAMMYDNSFRSGINIRYSQKLVDTCKGMGLTVSSYDRSKEPPEVKSVEGRTTQWGAEQAIEKAGRVPEVIYHTGDWGKEPMIILLGENAVDVAEVVVKVAQKSSLP